MPPHLVTRESERITAARGGGRTSARDLELMGEDDFNDLLEQISLTSLLKCTCDGGGDLGRYIGVPPTHPTSEAVRQRRTPTAATALQRFSGAASPDGLSALDHL